MSFTVGQKCWTPDSETMGQGVITEIGTDGDVKVAHLDIHGRKNERWFDISVVQLVPTAAQLEVQASNTFRAAHLKANDFNPCAANVKMMTDHMRANRWPWTAENLERAFVALRSRLAPVVAPVKETPMSQESMETFLRGGSPTTKPATPAAQAPTVPAAPATPSLTKADIKKMSSAELQQAMRDKPKEFEALGIPVLKTLDANRGRTKK